MSGSHSGRGMRLPFRVLWFVVYHLVLWVTLISSFNRPNQQPAFFLLAVGFVIGIGVTLQASVKLPAVYHGLAMFVFLPGLLLMAPMALNSAYQAAAMPQQNARVLSSSSHEASDITSLSGVRTYSYTDAEVQLTDGSREHAILRPERSVAAGSTVRLHVDPLDLIKPQNTTGDAPTALVVAFLVLGVLAEIEMISALARPEGGSFIANAARSAAKSDDGPSNADSEPLPDPR